MEARRGTLHATALTVEMGAPLVRKAGI